MDTFGLLLRKLAELSLLSTIIAVPLMYHLSLSSGQLGRLQEFLASFGVDESSRLFANEIQPFLGGLMPTLEMKFSAWFLLGIVMFAGYVAMKVFEGITRRSVYRDRLPQISTGGRLIRLIPLFFLTAFLVYALASILFWPPEIPLEAAQLSGSVAGGTKQSSVGAWIGERLGGGGFFYSMTAWLQVVFALFFLLVAEDLIRRRRFVFKIFALLLGVGLFNGLIVILQKVEFEPLMEIWVRFGEDNVRNRLGAFIGHNTGVASFLLAPLLISLTWLIADTPPRSRLVGVLLTIIILVSSLALLLTQSRAIIPLAVLMAGVLIFLLWRRSCLRPGTRIYIWLPVALLFLVLTQLVPTRFNPLYRQDVSLAERVSEFRPERLMTETRLRILAVSSANLIPESPFLGHGFGTFQYVYPEAQGQYFQDNPRSALAPTPLRTQRAHNEYLQLLVETGLAGLGLGLLALIFYLKNGLRVMQRTLMPHHIAIQAGVFVSILGLLLHCTVDFPLRVPPIALVLVLLLAIWGAGERIWIYPMLPPREDEDEDMPSQESVSRTAAGGPKKRFALLAAGALILAVLLAGVCALSVNSIIRFQSTATLLSRGEAMLRAFAQRPDQTPLLYEGYHDIKWAKRIFWISGPANRLMGQARYYTARENYLQSESLFELAAENQSNEGAPQERASQAAQVRGLARQVSLAAINDVNMSLSEEHFHKIYQLRYTIYSLLSRYTSGEESEEYRASAVADLQRAVTMNPGDPFALKAYIEILESGFRENYSEIVYYLGLLHHFHPVFFNEQVFQRVLDARALGMDQDAFDKMKLIAEAVPEDPVYRQVLAASAVSAGNVEMAVEIATSLLEQRTANSKNRPLREGANMVLATAYIEAGQYESALRLLQAADQYQSVEPSEVLALRLYALEATDEDGEADLIRAQLESLGEEAPRHYQIAGLIALRVFRQPEEAVYWLEKRRDATVPGLAMDLRGRVALARAYAELEQWEELRELIPAIDGEGETPYSRRLSALIVQELRSQLPGEGDQP